MKPLLHVQMDLFAAPARRLELTNSERQQAIALLRALLMEAAINQADVPASRGDGELGNE
jgi:ABC-type Fe3+/spermidine/putrescine transport system ATPase subunit